MTNKNKLSIVIPCFNEADNILIIIEKFQDILNSTNHSIEVIIVDGGSTDDTPAKLKVAFKDLNSEQFKLILKQERGGYGHDILYALCQAKGNILAWTHADLQTDPYDVVTAYELYIKEQQIGPLVIKGKRRNRNFLEAFFTVGMQFVAWLVLKTYIDDINAQPKLFSKEFFNKYLKQGAPSDFSLDLYMLYQAKKNKYKIVTFPVYFAKRLHGEAKGGGSWKGRIRLIVRTSKYILELKRNVEKS